ncbi:MAG: DsbA family protein [Candidatus Marsarchaeota archaeon]|nr:DsbA family protein [Candidatus Marsarchaeota archaeon]
MAKSKRIREPGIVVRPLGRFGGLDNLHLMLIILVVLLVLLLLVVSYGKPILVMVGNNTTGNTTALHTAAQIKAVAEHVLASYATVNSSLSLIPFISNISSMHVSYLPDSGAWYVQLMAKNLVNNVAFSLAFQINDTNTSKVTPLLQTALPSQISNNSVVSSGVVALAGKYACTNTSPTQVYWFIDPYDVGAVHSLLNASNIERMYGSNVNLTVKIVIGSATQRIGSQVGLVNALYLSKYAFCASQQSNFGKFASALDAAYSGQYMSQNSLASIAEGAGLNSTQLDSCITSSSSVLNTQALLAQYYNITFTPAVVVNCHYLALPQTAREALCYTNSTLC